MQVSSGHPQSLGKTCQDSLGTLHILMPQTAHSQGTDPAHSDCSARYLWAFKTRAAQMKPEVEVLATAALQRDGVCSYLTEGRFDKQALARHSGTGSCIF